MARMPRPMPRFNSPGARAMTYDNQGYVKLPTPMSPMTAFICDGTDLAAVMAASAAVFIACGSPLTPMDLCDGPVRS